MINIAVLGYGTVGSGVVEVFRTNHETINKEPGKKLRLNMFLIFVISQGIRLRRFLFMILNRS